MRSMRVRTSSAASDRSVPQSKFSWTWLLPSDELDSTRVRPGTALTACSIGPGDQLLHLERTDAGVGGARR